MNSQVKNAIYSAIGGTAFSLALLLVYYTLPRNVARWLTLPDLPGFIAAASIFGVHGDVMPINIVMVGVNSVFYGLITFGFVRLIQWKKGKSE